ncbi:MAG: dioxygenase [Sulfuricella sp.]|nr:dioxygenase [Sulfuricella sp.]
MTTLFVPHGAPTFALAPGAAGQALSDWATGREKPPAVLLVSAHWDSAAPCLGAAQQPETLHDYWGFPDELYDISYPAPGAPQVAQQAKELLDGAGFTVGLDDRRGLDHGAWIPLRILYPGADVPVATLSIQSALGPLHHYRVGQALAPLAAGGVLLIASGNLTHNLRHYQTVQGTQPPAYVREFQGWMAERIAEGNIAELLNYRTLAPGAVEAHPRDDHLLPLFVALGAAGENFTAIRLYEGIYDKILAMDAYVFHHA